MLTIRPVTPTHVPLQPLFIPCTWHTKSLLLYLNVFVPTTHSYVYVAFSITTCLVHCILVRAYFCDTIFGSLFTPGGPTGYWSRSMPFYACGVGTGAAGCG